MSGAIFCMVKSLLLKSPDSGWIILYMAHWMSWSGLQDGMCLMSGLSDEVPMDVALVSVLDVKLLNC